jgi:murein L,D-transpeptidase YcbB/YkuD
MFCNKSKRDLSNYKGENYHMKRLLLLGTIAAVALTTAGQAQSLDEQRRVVRRVAPKHTVNTERATVTRPSTNRNVVRRVSTVTPSTNRTVVRYYTGGGYYYGGSPYYYGGGYYPYSYGGPSVSIGIGGGYGYPGYYGYGYGYPYGYGYTYPSYYYGQYPAGYATTTTYATSRYGDLAYDDSLVIAVQRRLARAGYYHGAIDGVAGRATRSAIARWEANHGMYADGRIDRKTLRALGIG